MLIMMTEMDLNRSESEIKFHDGVMISSDFECVRHAGVCGSSTKFVMNLDASKRVYQYTVSYSMILYHSYTA